MSKKIKGERGLDKFIAKASKFGLPKALLFTKKGKTSASLKALSTEYRRKMLVGEVRAGKHNKDVIKRYKDIVKELPACIVLGEDGQEHQLFPKKPSFNRLNLWFSKLALKKPYYKDEVAQARIKAMKGDDAEEQSTEPTKEEKSKKEKKK